MHFLVSHMQGFVCVCVVLFSLVWNQVLSFSCSHRSKSWHQTHCAQVCSNQSQLVMDTKHPVTQLSGPQIGFYSSACTNHSLGKEPHYLSCPFECPPESLTIVDPELLSAPLHAQIRPELLGFSSQWRSNLVRQACYTVVLAGNMEWFMLRDQSSRSFMAPSRQTV